MLQKGTMRPVKKVLGIVLLAAGLGLALMPDKIVPILCENKMIFGLVVAFAGYLLSISGRQN